jgi:translation initiation factor 6
LFSLPDSVVVERVDEPLSALRNVISCNDHIAIHHPELESETVEAIGDVLGVDVFRQLIGRKSLVGTYSVFSNYGGVVSPNVSVEEIEALKGQLSLELTLAMVNRGRNLLGAGMCVNDFALSCGWETTALEIASLTRAFRIEGLANGGDALNIDEML